MGAAGLLGRPGRAPPRSRPSTRAPAAGSRRSARSRPTSRTSRASSSSPTRTSRWPTSSTSSSPPSSSASQALEEERLFSGPLRRRRRARHRQRRRGRHRRPGLGRDGAAHGDALGRAARLRRRAARGQPGGGGRHQVGDLPRRRARTPTACTRPRRACTGSCASSPFDSANRRQTSFAGVEVAPVIEDAGEVEIDADDLQVDTYRASGAGGQHVNKTDSAVRITHRPTRHRRAVPERALAAAEPRDRDGDAALQARRAARSASARRRSPREKGEAQDVNFGSQIRSYVLHPYTMVKDHRTNFEVGNAQRRARRRPRRLRARRAAARARQDGALVAVRPARREPARGPSSRPRPYLDAVVAYGFRGSGRFHVPGHKGGPGADPGLRSRARRPRAGGRHPAGHRGHRPRPVADAVRARRGARRRGLRRRSGRGF